MGSIINYTCSNATEVAQWAAPSCSLPHSATDNGIIDGRSNWLAVTPPFPGAVPRPWQYPLSATFIELCLQIRWVVLANTICTSDIVQNVGFDHGTFGKLGHRFSCVATQGINKSYLQPMQMSIPSPLLSIKKWIFGTPFYSCPLPLFSCPLYFSPYLHLSSYLPHLFLCLISFLLFPCASARKTLLHEFVISNRETEWCLFFSRGEVLLALAEALISKNLFKQIKYYFGFFLSMLMFNLYDANCSRFVVYVHL